MKQNASGILMVLTAALVAIVAATAWHWSEMGHAGCFQLYASRDDSAAFHLLDTHTGSVRVCRTQPTTNSLYCTDWLPQHAAREWKAADASRLSRDGATTGSAPLVKP